MEITVNNCNNIDRATISIEAGKLNIKHGPNGTGKSTIARAIALSLESNEALLALMPFKYREAVPAEEVRPSVEYSDPIKTLLLFNEDYINQFVFTQDEVLKNSFDVFIKTPQYEQKMQEIEDLISDIRKAFRNDERIDVVIVDLMELYDCFGKSSKGIAKSSKFVRGLGNGNQIENVPNGLEPYGKYIKSNQNLPWLKWQMSGNVFLEISDTCPYCTSPTAEKKDTILSVEKTYDQKSVEHLSKIQEVLEKLGEYFSDETKKKLDRVIKSKDGLKKEEESFLSEIKQQVDTLVTKLRDIKAISYFSLKDSGEIQKEIEKLKIDMSLLSHLSSESATGVIDGINKSLDRVVEKAGMLQGEINKQNKLVKETARKHKEEINNFLKYAGYKYHVDISEDSNTFKMKLKHLECPHEIKNGAAHLSYGEKNAFSLVLFMYECITKNPDLIVLDDPISSFDKNKKYAIIEMLFRSKSCLRNRTVLMLTHDIEPVVDMIKNLAHNFQPKPLAHFLSAKGGDVLEKEIKKENLLSFSQVCDRNIKTAAHRAIKSIYLRRYFEVMDEKGMEYELLSNVFKKRIKPTLRAINADGVVVEAEMPAERLASAEAEIRKYISDFDYSALVAELSDIETITRLFHDAGNNYEKLQIFRLINPDNHENNVIKKFVNETYHIENDYIMQLNPHEFDYVPDHIVIECANYLA